jgi:small subunit ribosomal protein S5
MTTQAVVVIGDKKQKVGVGIGRAEDANLAIEKAVFHAKKNIITVSMTVASSIPHVVKGSYGACSILLRPASEGTGVIAGGSIRTVLELAGMENIIGKQLGSNNLLNNAKATLLALNLLNEKIEIAKFQSTQKQSFYKKVLKKAKDGRVRLL